MRMSWGKFATLSVILLLGFISMIKFVFSSSIFIREFLLFGVLLIVAVILLTGVAANKSWAYGWFILFFAFMMLNMLYVYTHASRSFFFLIGALVVNFIGFLVAMTGTSPRMEKQQPKVEVVDAMPEKGEKAAAAKPAAKRRGRKPKRK
ncbi:hypothetical protein HY491_04360 [Candidatus Woesearchaeota archaeon]|nr:hypothetical protein [Candidatus Woesearchaeota archaeon]